MKDILSNFDAFAFL